MKKQQPTHNAFFKRQKLPSFLIVGATKDGTTSVYHYLKDHPDIFMPYSNSLQKIRIIIEDKNRVKKPLPVLSPRFRKELQGQFSLDVRRLEEYLGRSLKEVWF